MGRDGGRECVGIKGGSAWGSREWEGVKGESVVGAGMSQDHFHSKSFNSWCRPVYKTLYMNYRLIFVLAQCQTISSRLLCNLVGLHVRNSGGSCCVKLVDCVAVGASLPLA